MGMRLTLLESALIILSATGSLEPALAAGGDWVVMSRQAEKLIDNHNYQDALKLNREILNLIPADKLGKKLNTLRNIADCQMNLKMGNEMLATVTEMVDLGRVARRSDKLDTDGLLALNDLLVMSERGIPGTYVYKERVRLGKKLNEQVVSICQLGFPEKLTAERLDSMARNFIEDSDDAGALKALKSILPKANPDKPIYAIVEAQIAALEKRAGKPQQFEKLLQARVARHGFVEGTRLMSDAEMWIADYKACNASLDRCMDYLKKHPDDDKLLRCLNSRYVVIMDATGKAENGEFPLREAVAVAERLRQANKTKEAENQYQAYCRLLAENLEQQGPARHKEAQAWQERSREKNLAAKTARNKKDLQTELFLTEKDLRELEKFERSKKHDQLEKQNPSKTVPDSRGKGQ